MNERDAADLRVVCLCAGWCGVCRDYRATFEAAGSASFGTPVAFAWIDIEDDAALLDDLDVENFPTLLIARGDRPLFFGPITPQPATLARLVQRALDGALPPLQASAAPVAALVTLVRRLRRPDRSGP